MPSLLLFARDKVFESLKWLLLGLPKTVYVNFKMLPLKQAIRFPIIISHNVILSNVSGKFILNGGKPKRVRIGFGDIGIFDKKHSKSIMQISGTIECDGRVFIGHGSKLSVGGHLKLGENFRISSESTIICSNKITIGRDSLISWHVLIMDSDQHPILNMDNEIINQSAPIEIGEHVWIGCRAMVLKGISIADNVVIAANSNVCKSALVSNAAFGGNPIKIVKQNIKWEM